MSVEHALVVDDSKSARVMLSRLLSKGGMNVDLAESAEEALEYLKSQKPDVVFMDHMMPGMDGLEATRKITQDPSTASIPVVMYTSKEGAEYLAEAKSSGAIGVLPKPAKSPQITEVLSLLNSQSPIETTAANIATETNIAMEAAGLSKAEVEAIVEAAVGKAINDAVTDAVTDTVSSAMELIPQSSVTESSLQEAIDASLVAVKESLGFLETQAELTDSSVNSLNSRINETSEIVSQQETICQKMTEKMDADVVESVSMAAVNTAIAKHDAKRVIALEQKITRMEDFLETSVKRYDESIAQFESQYSEKPGVSELDEALIGEIQSLAELAGAEAATAAISQAAISQEGSIVNETTSTAAPIVIDSAAEDQLSVMKDQLSTVKGQLSDMEAQLDQMSKVNLAQTKSSNRTALYATILSLIAVGIVLL
ncbi:MAG: response regulator [Pseudomonadales bacterium]|nr:response regulator [Pseudomonadales bacterium]